MGEEFMTNEEVADYLEFMLTVDKRDLAENLYATIGQGVGMGLFRMDKQGNILDLETGDWYSINYDRVEW